MADADVVELTERPLTATEQADLVEAEETIAAGIRTYIDVGMALGKVHAGKLFRATHPTFGEYVRDRWGVSKSYAHSLMVAAGTVSPIADAGLPLPKNEAQARELGKTPEGERAEVWAEVIRRTNGVPTAAAIRDVQAERVSAERRAVWAEATSRAGGEAPTAEIIKQVRADRAAADSPPARDSEPTSSGPAVATTEPAGITLPGGDGPVEEAPAGGATPAGAGPAPTDQVWIATARKGIEGHRVPSLTAQTTPCGRHLANGLTLPAAQATEQHGAKWCPRCWPPAPPVVEAACARCGTMLPVDQLAELDEPDAGDLRCQPCRTQPPDDYVTTLLPYSALLPGDYLERWCGADGSVLGYDLVTRLELGTPTGRSVPPMLVSIAGRPDPMRRTAGTDVKVKRVAGRTAAAGGVTTCASCRAQVPIVITHNDRCPACITDVDRAAIEQAKLAAQAPDMVPGPDQEVRAAQIRAGDLLWAMWRSGSNGGQGWLPVTYAEIAAEPEGPGEWMVHLRTRTSTQHTATVVQTYYWDDEVQVRRPVPGTAEPATVAAPVDEPAAVAVPVDEPAAQPPSAAPSAKPKRDPLTVEQIGRVRAAYRAARAAGWGHVTYGDGDLGRDYGPDDPAPARPDRNGDPVARVDVSWDTARGEVEISYRSEKYHMYDTVLRVVDVDQGLDVLCALGLLPAEQSSAYLAGLAASRDGAR